MMSSRIKSALKIGESKKTNESEVNETSKKDDFSLSEIVRYGFPYRPSTVAYDPVQKVLAIGTKNGIIKIYGGAFVECSLAHPTEVEIVQVIFRVNEGALISACRDCIHLWSLRQKKPVIANSLRFSKEKISRCFLPLAFNSKWLLVGTQSGNVYVVNLDTFTLSSYKIMWNNAIGMSKSTHPGVVVDLCQNPDDPARLYIGFSTHLSSPNSVPIGHVVCWNLQQKTSENVYTLPQGLTSLSWRHDGKQFMCSHCDGSLSVWDSRMADKPIKIHHPHNRIAKDEVHKFGSISKVVWSSVKNANDTFVIFSGGMPAQGDSQQSSAANPTTSAAPSKPSSYFLTIVRGQTTNVLHMDNAIIDFHVITSSPHIADMPDPSAVVVLLENDLVVIDLKTENYPLFESLHTLDLHESPVTYCDYITEPNTVFYQNLLRLQSKQTPKRTYSQQENPISGGRSGTTIFGYNEVIITGHADGSIKFWDASGCNLLFLYKLRTNRLLDRVQATHPSPLSSSATSNASTGARETNSNVKFDTRSSRTNSNTGDEQVAIQQQLNSSHLSSELNPYENPYAIYSIKICCDGKYLIVAARGGHVTLFKFTGSELDKADEGLGDLSCLEIPILHRNLSGNSENLSSSGNATTVVDVQSTMARQSTEKKEFKSLLRAKKGYRRVAGYQPELVCLLSWLPNDRVPLLTDISINSKYGLLVFGLENGLVVVDYFSKFILMNMATADLYGTMDPFQRTTVSPKRRGTGNDFSGDDPTSSDYQLVEANIAAPPTFPPNTTGNLSTKTHTKLSKTVSQQRNSESGSAVAFRSRSIDSISGNDQTMISQATGGGDGSNDDKPAGPGTLANKFRTLRKRLSRSSHSSKHEPSINAIKSSQNDKENAMRSGADDSEASSAGEEFNQSSFTAIPTSNPDLTEIESATPTTAVSLKVHRSLPLERTASIAANSLSSSYASDGTKRTNGSESGSEGQSLSKTWSSSAFTGAQLRGTCSLEYTEHMRDKSHKRKAHVVDLRKDDGYHHHQQQQQQQQMTTNTMASTNRPSVVDLPRSSSASSLDNIVSNENVCAIQFSESFTYKGDFTISPSIWLGTSTGCVIVINLNVNYEPRNISVVPSGSVFRLFGRVVHISFLDHKGAIVSPPSEKWDAKKTNTGRPAEGFAQPQDANPSTVLPGSSTPSSAVTPSSSATSTSNNIQYAVFCSSKQARVVSLPSQVCISKQKIHDALDASSTNVLRASVVKVSGSPCLTCYLSGSRIHVYSLPSLRELFNVNLPKPLDSFRLSIASTFTFTNRGHGLYMCSPTEIQKITIASEVKEQISEMLCDLYSPSIVMPEAPKQSIFAKIFTSNSAIDSDQLFGEAAGKAPLGVAKKEDVYVNMNQMHSRVDSATSVVNDTRMKLLERGRKLGELEDASRQMTDRAEEFASLTHKIMLKQKEKSDWWSFTSKKS